MDFYSLFQIIQKFPGFKNIADLLRQQIRSSLRGGEISEEELLRRLRDSFPALMDFLKVHKEDYKKARAENLRRQARGIRLLVFGEALYPEEFYLMPDPPLTLMFWGEPCWRRHDSFSIVGSREPREESLIWMEREISSFLEQLPLHIVSGGARGVDQKAHSLAVRKNLPTTVILPSGLGEIYPSSLQDWIAPVLETGGCFLSEYSYEQKMQKFLFHHRNRLIAALGKAILIVEARQRSGTLLTAQQGAQWGRPIFVVPGHPHDTHFAGSLNLLSEGATLVRDAQDLDIFFRAEMTSPKGLNVSVEEFQRLEHYP